MRRACRLAFTLAALIAAAKAGWNLGTHYHRDSPCIRCSPPWGHR